MNAIAAHPNPIMHAQVDLPDGRQGIAEIDHFEITPDESDRTRIRGILHAGEFVETGRYTRLFVRGNVMMSDTRFERFSNREVVRRAHGRMLVAGLGIGLVLVAAFAKPNVEHITVIEKYPDVVDLVAPSLLARFGDRLRVITADIFEWRPDRGQLFNVVYFDIWSQVSLDTLRDMARLHRAFARRLDRSDPHCWMDSWQHDSLVDARNRGTWR
jgi:spermidine synthase